MYLNLTAFAELAKVSKAAVSRATKKGPLVSARAGRTRVRLDSPAAWRYLARNRKVCMLPNGKILGVTREFLEPFTLYKRGEEGVRYVNLRHPHAIAYVAGSGFELAEFAVMTPLPFMTFFRLASQDGKQAWRAENKERVEAWKLSSDLEEASDAIDRRAHQLSAKEDQER